MKIQFICATHEVTGSCTLLEVGGRFYMIDCGMLPKLYKDGFRGPISRAQCGHG